MIRRMAESIRASISIRILYYTEMVVIMKTKESGSLIAPKNDYYVLIPNVSFGIFKFGATIESYCRYEYESDRIPDRIDSRRFFDRFYFPYFNIRLWSYDGNTIDSVLTDSACILEGKNIIGMPFKLFQEKYGPPDDSDIIFLPQDDRQTHHVYDYDSLGLQLWTWRNRIVEVIAYDGNASEDE